VPLLVVREDQRPEAAGIVFVGHVERVQVHSPPIGDGRWLVGERRRPGPEIGLDADR
jgi:hypothetical protein